jgi:hypothetical protein
MSAACPVYTQQQTFPDPVGTSHLCFSRKRCSRAAKYRDARLFM